MEKYINEAIKETDNILYNKNNLNLNKIIDKHLTRISFIKHERLIHLLVTFFFTILTILSYIAIYLINIYFIIITIILLIILLFYIKHYYFLENKLQYMYKQYEKLIKDVTNNE